MKNIAHSRTARIAFAALTGCLLACSGAPSAPQVAAGEADYVRPVTAFAQSSAGRIAAETRREAAASLARLEAQADAAAERAAAEEAAEAERVVRRMKAKEVTTAHGLEATRILKSTYHLPMGSEIPYELDGAPFVAKIELHWHEPHVHPLPWGWHRGISLYVVEPAS